MTIETIFNEIWLALVAAFEAFVPAAWVGGGFITLVYGLFGLGLLTLFVVVVLWILDGLVERAIYAVLGIPFIGWALAVVIFVAGLFLSPMLMTWFVLIFISALRAMPWVYFVVVPVFVLNLYIGWWHYKNEPWLPEWMNRLFHFLTRGIFRYKVKSGVVSNRHGAREWFGPRKVEDEEKGKTLKEGAELNIYAASRERYRITPDDAEKHVWITKTRVEVS
ncbi:hypothetical protein ACFL1M_03575 [Patescibacteria group bacterium]